MQIFDCELTVGAGRFGRVCAIDDTSFTINSGLGGIRISRVRIGKSGKINSAEFIRDKKIELGRRFGT